MTQYARGGHSVRPRRLITPFAHHDIRRRFFVSLRRSDAVIYVTTHEFQARMSYVLAYVGQGIDEGARHGKSQVQRL